jgi:hypothetical protein
VHCAAPSAPIPRCIIPSSIYRFIGFLTRCALSKPFPELSIINMAKSMSLATGRMSEELSAAVLGDGAQGDCLAYAGTPTTRPHSLRTLPFSYVKISSDINKARQELQTAYKAHAALRVELAADVQLRRRIGFILGQDNPQWNTDDSTFKCCVGAQGVWRDMTHEKQWDFRANGQLVAGEDSNRHVFACACSERADVGSGVLVRGATTAEGYQQHLRACSMDSSSSSSSTESEISSFLLGLSSQSSQQSASSSSSSSSYNSAYTSSSSSMSAVRPTPPQRIHPPLQCSQRAPFEYHEDIAYGLVKRWIMARQRDDGLRATIAHVRIFQSFLERETGCPIIVQRSHPEYEDHYMLAKHIVCRITLSPLPNDTSQYLVSHVV